MKDPYIVSSSSRSRRRPWLAGLGGFILVVAALVALYAWLMLHWSYGDGERAGVLQKFSRKGWLCKTYEGELALYVVGGVAPQIWYFSTRDVAVARQLTDLVGRNVRLHYDEHRGVPTTCFGDTKYFATGVTPVDAH